MAFVAGLRFVAESKPSGMARYDIPGAATVTLGLASPVYGFTKASTR